MTMNAAEDMVRRRLDGQRLKVIAADYRISAARVWEITHRCDPDLGKKLAAKKRKARTCAVCGQAVRRMNTIHGACKVMQLARSRVKMATAMIDGGATWAEVGTALGLEGKELGANAWTIVRVASARCGLPMPSVFRARHKALAMLG